MESMKEYQTVLQSQIIEKKSPMKEALVENTMRTQSVEQFKEDNVAIGILPGTVSQNKYPSRYEIRYGSLTSKHVDGNQAKTNMNSSNVSKMTKYELPVIIKGKRNMEEGSADPFKKSFNKVNNTSFQDAALNMFNAKG